MEKSRSIAVAVVIYNESCMDSKTCRTLEKVDLPVLLYDNSTVDKGNKQYCEDHGWVFLGGVGNVGLSRAYNTCIDYVKKTNSAQILCLFDDDTEFDPVYFQRLMEAIQCEGKIFVPLVYANGELLSPCLLDAGHKARRFSNETQVLSYTGNSLSAINSGMAVDISLFDDYQYDEKIFLDGVDHKFLMDMKNRGEKIHVFPYRCNQTFSGTEKQSLNAAKNRFEIFAKDYKYILGEDKVAYLLLVGKRALKLSLQYKYFGFLSAVCRNYKKDKS